MTMTKLERIIAKHLGAYFKKMPAEELQARLDEKTDHIRASIGDNRDIVDAHMTAVYNAMAIEYNASPRKVDVIDELITFMNMISHGGLVLDIGCAGGRDSLFMASEDETFRVSLMRRVKDGKKTIEKFDVPEKSFRVIGIDNALSVLVYAQRRLMNLSREGNAFSFPPLFWACDMTELEFLLYEFADILEPCSFDGIWSCTTLFTHMSDDVSMEGALISTAGLLKKDGIFFTSYTNGTAEEKKRHKFLVSSTGHIKYFSQPNPRWIAQMADSEGLSLIAETYSDMERPNAPVKKRLFVSQFFRKR